LKKEKKKKKKKINKYHQLIFRKILYNKKKEYNSVIEISSIGLKIKPLPKLLSFRAIAYAYTEEFDDAKADIENLENILKGSSEDEYNDIAGAIEYVNYIIEERKKIYIEKNKKYSRAIFRQYLYYNKQLKNRPLIPPIEPNPKNPIVFFDIKIGENEAKKIEIELFKDIVPITAENFLALCLGTHEGMTYKGTSLNKVIKSFVIGGGELENYTGKEKCVYGQYFDDENYIYGHCRRGLLTMDNDGKNTNNSKFLITLKYIPWFDGKHVVFGQIIKGLDVLK
jgi:cyclophilin family peptidyl-prolyl cis-trans isomerase